MAVTFTNNFKNILDKLESIIETEFKGALPVYKGNTVPKGVNQAIQLIPVGSNLLEYNVTSETREFTIDIKFIFNEANIKERALDHVLRFVSRIEALIHDNTAVDLVDNSNLFNCRIESTELNSDEESGLYVVDFEYKCQHLGNIG
tara:strand:+ start:818 stop:1255 length:438 start_codon:yes stop_codon:yes gene_type:complete